MLQRGALIRTATVLRMLDDSLYVHVAGYLFLACTCT